MIENNFTLFVDADSCPVKWEIVDVCANFNLEVVFVASYAHVTTDDNSKNSRSVYVDNEKEAADLYIVNNAAKGDLTITDDLGLASLLLPQGIAVITSRGKILKEAEMATKLHIRHLKAKARRSGKYDKGPSALTKTDKINFRKTLYNFLSKKEGF